MISDWCAKIYEHDDFNGWEKVVGEASQLNLNGNEDNQLTSVRVRPGCTLDLFDNWNNDGFLGSLTSNVSLVNYNDKVSSLSCTCNDVVDKGDGTEDPEGDSLEDTTTHITTTLLGKISSIVCMFVKALQI